VLISPRHAHQPRVTTDFAVLDERARDIRFEVDVDLFTAVRTRDLKLVGHFRDRNNGAMVASASGSWRKHAERETATSRQEIPSGREIPSGQETPSGQPANCRTHPWPVGRSTAGAGARS